MGPTESDGGGTGRVAGRGLRGRAAAGDRIVAAVEPPLPAVRGAEGGRGGEPGPGAGGGGRLPDDGQREHAAAVAGAGVATAAASAAGGGAAVLPGLRGGTARTGRCEPTWRRRPRGSARSPAEIGSRDEAIATLGRAEASTRSWPARTALAGRMRPSAADAWRGWESSSPTAAGTTRRSPTFAGRSRCWSRWPQAETARPGPGPTWPSPTITSPVRSSIGLGRLEEGERHLRRAIELRGALAAEHPDDPAYGTELSRSLSNLGDLQHAWRQDQRGAGERPPGPGPPAGPRPALARRRAAPAPALTHDPGAGDRPEYARPTGRRASGAAGNRWPSSSAWWPRTRP